MTVGKLNSKEADFVCGRQGRRLYVQVAYLIPDEKTHEREFGNLLALTGKASGAWSMFT